MRKVIVVIFIGVCFLKAGFAQSDGYELGVRLGNSVITADLTIPVKYHRIRTNAGWGYEYLLFDNYFQMVFPVYREERFIYAGIGPGFRYWDAKRSSYDGFGFAVAGDIGAEIKLRKADFTIGLDANPAYDLIMEKFIMNVTASIRYRL